MSTRTYLLYDARANIAASPEDVDRASVLECCDTLQEAWQGARDAGYDCSCRSYAVVERGKRRILEAEEWEFDYYANDRRFAGNGPHENG